MKQEYRKNRKDKLLGTMLSGYANKLMNIIAIKDMLDVFTKQ